MSNLRIDPVTKKPVLWTEVSPILCGRWCVGQVEDDNGSQPFTTEDKDQALRERQDMVETYQQQIEDGERSDDDQWEGSVFPCRVEGKFMVLLNEDDLSEIERFEWRD